jgi:hypothetical protein
VLYPHASCAGQSINQEPELTKQWADSTLVTNIGNASLRLSYGNKEWTQATIQPGETIVIPAAAGQAFLSFHDGKEAKTMALERGLRYALYWNKQAGRWSVDVYDNVARRPTGFRSQ